MKLKKVTLRAIENGFPVSTHFCYIDDVTYNALRHAINPTIPMNAWFTMHIAKWYKEDFLQECDKDVKMDNLWDVYCIRHAIKEKCYLNGFDPTLPEGKQTVYIQGIVREWLTRHIRKYLTEEQEDG